MSSIRAYFTSFKAAASCVAVLFSTSPKPSSTGKILSGSPVIPMKRTKPCSLSFTRAGSVSFTTFKVQNAASHMYILIKPMKVPKLNVMGLDEVDIVHLESPQAVMHTLRDSGSAEVKLGLVIASNLGGKNDLVPRQALQPMTHHLKMACSCSTQGVENTHYLRAGDTIVRRGVKEIDALFESFLDSFCSLLIS
ncbi:MAG: hypothetical protein FRX49_05685 [Trebouxia sp. A1-2]|nr:MAG: hypothetical protein FRX49_05685 [Trebouxia sp. A1-2]